MNKFNKIFATALVFMFICMTQVMAKDVLLLGLGAGILGGLAIGMLGLICTVLAGLIVRAFGVFGYIFIIMLAVMSVFFF